MGLLGKLLKTTIDIATLPIDVTKDVVTLGGTLTDKSKPYTAHKFERLGDDAEELRNTIDKL